MVFGRCGKYDAVSVGGSAQQHTARHGLMLLGGMERMARECGWFCSAVRCGCGLMTGDVESEVGTSLVSNNICPIEI